MKIFEAMKEVMPEREIRQMEDFYQLSEDLNEEELKVIAAAMYMSLSLKNKQEIIKAINELKNFKEAKNND